MGSDEVGGLNNNPGSPRVNNPRSPLKQTRNRLGESRAGKLAL